MIVKIKYKLEQNETIKVKKTIKEKHLSLREIAPKLDITYPYLHNLVQGYKWFSEDQLTRLEEILDLKLH